MLFSLACKLVQHAGSKRSLQTPVVSMSEEDQMLVPEELEGKVQIVWGVDVIDKDRLVTPGAMKFDGDLNVVDR